MCDRTSRNGNFYRQVLRALQRLQRPMSNHKKPKVTIPYKYPSLANINDDMICQMNTQAGFTRGAYFYPCGYLPQTGDIVPESSPLLSLIMPRKGTIQNLRVIMWDDSTLNDTTFIVTISTINTALRVTIPAGEGTGENNTFSHAVNAGDWIQVHHDPINETPNCNATITFFIKMPS